MRYRVGQGFDVHAFGEGDHVMLGGIQIPHNSGLIAHSDGDVLIHSLCDAMLGAIALGDIGQHFPDSDPRYKGISSKELLKQVKQLLESSGWQISNIDLTLIAQAPKIAAFSMQIRHSVATLLCIDISQVSLKATTTERLGFTGREEGIASMAVVLLESQRPS